MVDDSLADVFFIREAFEQENLAGQIEVVRDGEEAMDFLNKQGAYQDSPTPNLILLDLNMPRKSGQQTLAEIKSHAQLRKLPVIVLTTSDDPIDIETAYESYANCYITKPVDFLGYASVVRRIKEFWLSLAKLPTSA